MPRSSLATSMHDRPMSSSMGHRPVQNLFMTLQCLAAHHATVGMSSHFTNSLGWTEMPANFSQREDPFFSNVPIFRRVKTTMARAMMSVQNSGFLNNRGFRTMLRISR